VIAIVIAIVNTFGIGIAAIVTKRLLSGRTVTTTEITTVARVLLSTAIDNGCETEAAFLREGRLCFVVNLPHTAKAKPGESSKRA
jgi:hypothetical protein